MSSENGVVFGEGAERARAGLEHDLRELASRVLEVEARRDEALGVVKACREKLLAMGVESRRLQHSWDALVGKARRGRRPKGEAGEA